MSPPQECLTACHCICRQINKRLVVHLELSSGNSPSQIRLQVTSLQRLGLVFRIEKPECTTTACFSCIHREIGALQQIVNVVAMIRRDSNSQASVHEQFLSLAVHGGPQSLQYLLCELCQVSLITATF